MGTCCFQAHSFQFVKNLLVHHDSVRGGGNIRNYQWYRDTSEPVSDTKYEHTDYNHTHKYCITNTQKLTKHLSRILLRRDFLG